MRLQSNGSWITYQHLSDGLQPLMVLGTWTWDAGGVPQGSLLGRTTVITGWRVNRLIFQPRKGDFAQTIAQT